MKARLPRLVALILATLGLWLFPLVAAATAICGDIAVLLSDLKDRYQEELVGFGNANGGDVYLTATPEGATWTIVVHAPGEPACIVAAGRNWYAAPPPAPGVEG